MKNGIILLTLIISMSLYAEDNAPSSTPLIIPTVIVEFESRAEKNMELIVPDYDEIALPDLEIYLADPGEIPIEEMEFDLPLPDFVEFNYSEGSPFFSEGFLGFGSKNHLVGNISLFRLGEGLRFSLSFAHDGLDGFGQNAAGTGYFYRREAFEGDFRNGDESFMLSGSISFKENEDGLQQQVPSYTSVIHRLSNMELGISGNGKFSWNGDLSLNIAEKTLTGETPVLYNELGFSAAGGIGWKKDWFSVSLKGDYEYDQNEYINTCNNIFSSDLQLGFSFAAVDIFADAGIFWLPEFYPEYPFSISISGVSREIFQYQTSAGYSIQKYLNYKTWNDYSFFGASDGIDKGWFWDGKFTGSPLRNIDFGFQWLYRDMDSYMSVDLDSFDLITGLFRVTSIQGNYLDLSPFIKFELSSGWSMLFGWNGQMLKDKDILNPVYSVSSEIEYLRDDYGLFFSGEYSLDPLIIIPSVSIGAHYAVSDGVELSLEGHDILGYFSEDRKLWGNYISGGGTVTLVTKISL